MAFLRPTLADLITRSQADLVSRLSLTNVAVRRSVVSVIARVIAGAAYLLHGHLEYLAKQIFPDTSELAYLERQAALYGLARLAATYATGNLTLSGTNGTVVPAGSRVRRSDGAEYSTNAEATIASGTATVAVTAVEAGVAGNTDAAVVLTFVSPINGLTATAPVAAGGLVSGTDAETDDALRARVLDRLRQPPHGGASADYVTWAKEVAGVTRAWVYPLELGAGTVTVRFVRDDDASLIPDAGEVAAVQAYIDARRPVTAAVTVAAPVAVPLDLTLHIVPDTSATRAAVEAELRDLLARDAQPGTTLLLSQIRLAVSVAEGVTDYSITTPAANVTHATGQIPTLGGLTWV